MENPERLTPFRKLKSALHRYGENGSMVMVPPPFLSFFSRFSVWKNHDVDPLPPPAAAFTTLLQKAYNTTSILLICLTNPNRKKNGGT